MNVCAQAIAEDASFRAFVNCYLREVQGGKWVQSENGTNYSGDSFSIAKGIEVSFKSIPSRVLLEVTYQSLVGCHHFGRVFLQQNSSAEENEGRWHAIEKISLLQMLINDIYLSRSEKDTPFGEHATGLKKNELELSVRLLESYQLMTHYLEARKTDAGLTALDFISTEQSSLYGHWLHPTPKSRQGMTFWQQGHYSPELKGAFKLHYFSVDAELVKQGGSLSYSTSDVFEQDLKESSENTFPKIKDGHLLIPAHPLQAQYLLLQDWVKALIASGQILYLGPIGDEFTATSSVRTLCKRSGPWMYKFSIPVKITNSLRCNKLDELETGMAIEQYMKTSGFLERHPSFSMIDDPAYLTVVKPGHENQESGFEVVLRRNPFVNDAGEGICSVLALVQEPLLQGDNQLGESLLKQVISQIAQKERRSATHVAMDWFERYFSCAIEPLIYLYDQEGIALEAHQQNSVLELSTGYPSHYYYRDNQGFYLSKSYQSKLNSIADKLTMSNIFYDDDVIFEAISYYLFINQLFSVIYRLGADGLAKEEDLLTYVRQALTRLQSQLTGVGETFIDHILSGEVLSYKANLMARVRNIDELEQGMERAVYASLANPFYKPNLQRDTSRSPASTQNQTDETVDTHVA